MPCKYSYTLPIIWGSLMCTTFIVSYVIAVSKKDVTPDFPYISDTGTWSPESCLFGLMLNIGALLEAAIIYVRYRQIKYTVNKETQLLPSIEICNKRSLYLGYISSFGVSVVGNFQETNLFIIHVFGAVLAFGGGLVYEIMQTRISFQLYPSMGHKTINITRLVCCVIGVLSFITTGIFAGISLMQFRGDDPTKWTKNDGGYINHFISAVAEWVLATSLIVFLLLYTQEFKKYSFSEPPIIENV